jgi:hypothetical protein
MSFLKSVFGGEKVDAQPVKSTIPDFSGGGLSSIQNGNTFAVTPDATRLGVVGGLSDTFKNLGDITGSLRDTVAPGFNDMLTARLGQINDTARSALGNLSDNLRSRRILGSSFGEDTITRAQSEFARQRQQATADNFIQSLQQNNSLLKQQFEAYTNAFTTKLGELNLEANLASGISSKAADIFAANAQTTAKLQEDASKSNVSNDINLASGLGSFLGRVFFPTPPTNQKTA